MRTTHAVALILLLATNAHAQAMKTPTPADGFGIHVSAPHMIQGREMGTVHHYCKPIAPDPIIQCLLYDSAEPNAPLTGVEYIVAKRITRSEVPLGTWNQNFHDHTVEIATGRVQVLDLPAEEAKKVADLVATTDGIIFHIVAHGRPTSHGERRDRPVCWPPPCDGRGLPPFPTDAIGKNEQARQRSRCCRAQSCPYWTRTRTLLIQRWSGILPGSANQWT